MSETAGKLTMLNKGGRAMIERILESAGHIHGEEARW